MCDCIQILPVPYHLVLNNFKLRHKTANYIFPYSPQQHPNDRTYFKLQETKLIFDNKESIQVVETTMYKEIAKWASSAAYEKPFSFVQLFSNDSKYGIRIYIKPKVWTVVIARLLSRVIFSSCH